MKRLFYFLLLLLLLIGCRSISVEQRKLVRQFADKSAQFSELPAAIWIELAEIREGRGVYYANSMIDPEHHLQELDAIIKERMNDDRIPGRVSALFKVLDSYAAGLSRLSSDTPFKKRSQLFDRWGDDLESLIVKNNQLNQEYTLPTGAGTLLTRFLDSGSNHWLASRQMKMVQQYVNEADTLVTALSLSMGKYLSSPLLAQLIQNEALGITESFRFYYAKRSPPALESDRDYIALRKKAEELSQLQRRSLIAVRNLAKAHKLLVTGINGEQSPEAMLRVLQHYYMEIDSLRIMVKKLNL